MSIHVNRMAAALLTAVMMLTVLAGTTLAATQPSGENFSFAERGITAQASWEACEDPDSQGVTRCAGTQVFVFDGRQRNTDALGRHNGALTYLCVFRYDVAFDEQGAPVGDPIEEQGCKDDPELTVVRTLERVTAATTELVLTRWICAHDPETGEASCEEGSSRTVSVQATFDGIGDIASERWTSASHSDEDGVRCRYSSSGSGIRRISTAETTIDGRALGPSTDALLSDGKTRFTQKCM